MTFNAVTSAHVDLCELSKTCKSQDCNDSSSSTNSTSKSGDASAHGHCNVHCFQQYFYSHSQALIFFTPTKIVDISFYQFVFTQTILDGPFRPPLV